MNDIKIKRAYDDAADDDGYRILIDRLWPRGVSKERARLDEWAKEVTPTTELRKAVHDGEIDWPTFDERYGREIEDNADFDAWRDSVRETLKKKDVTLVTGAKLHEPHGHPYVLKKYLQK